MPSTGPLFSLESDSSVTVRHYTTKLLWRHLALLGSKIYLVFARFFSPLMCAYLYNNLTALPRPPPRPPRPRTSY